MRALPEPVAERMSGSLTEQRLRCLTGLTRRGGLSGGNSAVDEPDQHDQNQQGDERERHAGARHRVHRPSPVPPRKLRTTRIPFPSTASIVKAIP